MTSRASMMTMIQSVQMQGIQPDMQPGISRGMQTPKPRRPKPEQMQRPNWPPQRLAQLY